MLHSWPPAAHRVSGAKEGPRSRLNHPDPTMGKRKEAGSDKEVWADYITANVLGANTGAVLKGVGANTRGRKPTLTPEALNSVQGVVLKVVQGVVLPYKDDRQLAHETYDKTDEQGWAKRVAGDTGLSPPQAQQLINFFASEALEKGGLLGHTTGNESNGGPHKSTAGVECKFVIQSAGTWNYSELIMEWMQNETVVTAAQIMGELHRASKADPSVTRPGRLAMRQHLWVEGQSVGQVEPKPDDVVFVNVSKTLCFTAEEAHYDVKLTMKTDERDCKKEVQIDQTIRIVAPPPESQLEIQEVPGLVLESIKYMMSDACKFREQDEDGSISKVHLFGDLTVGQAEAQVKVCFEVLSGPKVSFGALKSCIQKLARVQANRVRMPKGEKGGKGEIVDGRVAIMVALGMLFTSRGSGFVPDLGLYVRGATSALKRLGVIMVEDAWPAREHLKGLPGLALADRDPGVVMAAILATSLLTSQVADYYPRRSIIRNCMHVMAAALHSDKLISWRDVNMVGSVVEGRANRDYMFKSAELLRTLRAFKGDMCMFDQVAKMVNDQGLILTKSNPHDPGGVIPLLHLIDQHVYRGFAHAILHFRTLSDQSFNIRFQTAFDNVTGFSPRISNRLIEEEDVVVRTVRYAQSIVALRVFPGLLKDRLSQDGGAIAMTDVVEESLLDYGVMSAGVNSSKQISVVTSAEENEQDSFFPGGVKASEKWSLQVILPVEKPGEIVIHFVTAHGGENKKKPAITANAKRKAVAKWLESAPFRFSSPMLPAYSRVDYQSGQYIIKGSDVPDLVWKFDSPNSVDVAYSMFVIQNAEDANLDIRKNANILKWASHRPPGSKPAMAAQWKELVTSIFENVPMANARILRMLTFIKQKYDKVTLPTPGLKGDQASDQMRAFYGDWVVWRLMLAISWVCPGALTPKQIPAFDVPDARLLRMVEKHLQSLVVNNGQTRQQQSFQQQVARVEALWDEEGARKPYEYQLALVNNMLKRDRSAIVPTQGHFVSLDTGLGKSFVGLYYALSHAADIGNVARIIWVAPKEVLETIAKEATDWGIESVLVNRSQPYFQDGTVNLVAMQWFQDGNSRGKLEDALRNAATNALIVFDEVHTMYGAGVRNSTMREAALLSSKFVAMTATPIGRRKDAFAIDWLADSVGFPVSRNNELVAAAMMVAARVSLPIEGVESLAEVIMDPADQMKHTELLKNGRRWQEASEICRVKTTPFLVRTAVEAAIADRVLFPDGGAMVVLDNDKELAQALEMANQMIKQRGLAWVAKGRTLDTSLDPLVGLIGVTKRDVTGYNLTRMGAMATGVYASSPASRHQLRGRIRRIGQVRSKVEYITVVPKHTILDLLHQRHNALDKKNESLAELADVIAAQA